MSGLRLGWLGGLMLDSAWGWYLLPVGICTGSEVRHLRVGFEVAAAVAALLGLFPCLYIWVAYWESLA